MNMLPNPTKTSGILLAMVALLILWVQPFYTWFAADDFCYIQSVRANGWIGNMWQEYLSWDGRSISLTYPVCRFGLWTGKYWVGPMLGTLLLMGIAHLMLLISGLQGQGLREKWQRRITLTAALWLVCFYFSSQTLYWTTGIGYNLDVVMLFMAFYWLKRWKGEGLDYWLGIPIFFYAGTCSPNGVLALLFALGVQWLYEAFIIKNAIHKKYALAFAWMLLAFAMVVLSPGNARRMTGWDANNLTHIWTIYFNIKRLLGDLIAQNSPLLWPFLAMGLLGGTLAYRNQNIQGSVLQKLLGMAYQHRLLLAAIISCFFFLPLPGMHSPRTNIQFAMFGVLYGLTHLPGLINLAGDRWTAANSRFLSQLILIIFITIGGSQVFDARYVKGQLALRDAKLKSMRGQSVTLTEDDFVRTPTTRRFEDLATDSSYWLNKCVADHYGLKSIKLVDRRPKKMNYGQLTE
jgi:hypothetical protein